MKDKNRQRTDLRDLISILIESPFYLTIALKERYALVQRLVSDYDLCPDIKNNWAEWNDE